MYITFTMLFGILPLGIVYVKDNVPALSLLTDMLTALGSTTLRHCLSLDPSWILQWMTYLVGPIFWILCGVFAGRLGRQPSSVPFDPILHDINTPPREIRRHLQRYQHRTRRRMKVRSARDHGLRPTYPLRLRRTNTFNSRSSAPSIFDRELHNLHDNFRRRADNAASAYHRSRSHAHPSHRHRRRHPSRNHLSVHQVHQPVIARRVDTRQPYRPVAIPTVTNPRPNLRPTRNQRS